MKSKIFILTISCLALFIVLFSCKKKNTIIDNNPPNKPSTPFFTTETNLIGDNITFKVTAVDLDEDSIAARFDWGDGDTSGWCDFIPSGDTVIGNHCYRSKGTFYIRAQAKDYHEGISDWSEPNSIVIQDSAWTLVWTCATQSAQWSPRENHTAVVFNNKIWILGGSNANVDKNDVWFSADGMNWNCATESAGWSRRSGHTSVVFDNKIWVIGGWDIRPTNDVWFSSDGLNWTCATESAGWLSRSGHTSVVFENKIWVLGGWDGHSSYNDVWYSNDGINWTCVNETAQWKVRKYSTSVIIDNKIWVLGGIWYGDLEIYNDVWYSNDGDSWVCVTDSAGWSDRYGHTSVIFDDKIWVMGGCARDYYYFGPSNDVWFSYNGNGWTCKNDSAPWPKREWQASVVFDNKIWILGGYPELNDVWYGEIVHGKR